MLPSIGDLFNVRWIKIFLKIWLVMIVVAALAVGTIALAVWSIITSGDYFGMPGTIAAVVFWIGSILAGMMASAIYDSKEDGIM